MVIKATTCLENSKIGGRIDVAAEYASIQVLAFQKSWRSFSPITVCIIAQCQCPTGGGVGGWGHVPPPPRRGRGECPKIFFRTFICTVMFWWCLGCFWVVWGISYFEAVGFQKRNLAHYMYGDGLVVFGVFWVCLGYFEAVGFPKKKFSALFVR